MNTDDAERKVADLTLERYLLGELPPGEMERMRQLIEADAALRQRLEALSASDQSIREQYPAAWMARQIESKLEEEATVGERARKPGWMSGWLPSLGWPRLSMSSAVPVLVILVALVSLPVVFGPESDPTVRPKGGPRMILHRKTASGSESLAHRDVVRQGDQILVQYQTGDHDHGVILSIDGRGTVTQHLPDGGRSAARLQVGPIVSLPFAYELDDAPHWERFYFITAAETFAVETAMRAAQAVAARIAAGAVTAPDSLDLPDGLDQSIVTLLKSAGHDDPELRSM